VSERSVEHLTFVVERTYEASPARVFAAWADPEAKARWFGQGPAEYELDLRVGGREHSRGELEGGAVYSFDAIYQDIVLDERIVFTYEMHLDGARISLSLATVELAPEAAGTRLVYTEQGAFLDGHDDPAQREHGMGGLLDALGEELEREAAGA
jgi:uncharacterized protein YndB with AHSA1/START domain